MLKLSQSFIVVLAVLAGAASEASAQATAGRRGPLLAEMEVFPRVVILDPDEPFGLLDLHFLIENVSKNQTVTVTDIQGELLFRDGETTSFVLDPPEEPLPPTFGSAYFALLVIPPDAARGLAQARIAVTYRVGSVTRTIFVRDHFVIRRQ